MIITKVAEMETVPTVHKVDVKKLYETEYAQVMHIKLQPGESLKPHITPVDVFFFILEGNVNIRIGDETLPVNRDSLVESPKNIVHCLSNSSELPARILVTKVPKPQTQSHIL